MSRGFNWKLLVLCSGLVACAVDRDDDEDETTEQVGDPAVPGNPYTGGPQSCDDMGGETLTNGACAVRCTYDADAPDNDLYDSCPTGLECQIYWEVCRAPGGDCATDADCGMEGWVCKQPYGECFMPCEFEVVECPSGWYCDIDLLSDELVCMWDGF